MKEEEKNKSQDQVFPEPTVGPIIYNDKSEILLIRSHKWGELWHIPGGHVELGETCEEALKREIKEETNLDVDKIEFLGWQEAINPESFHKKRHFIFLDFSAHLAGGEVTKSDEMKEYKWIYPQDALKTLKIDPYTIKTIQFYLQHLENKKGNLVDKYKRALADYQNLVKQTAKEKGDFAKFANENLLYEILPVYDHLKLALEHANGTTNGAEPLVEGVGHVVKQFKDTLSKLGVEEIQTIGKAFDHNLMEAISEEETDNEKQDGIVAKEVKAGYRLNGKVIMPAKVVVYKFK